MMKHPSVSWGMPVEISECFFGNDCRNSAHRKSTVALKVTLREHSLVNILSSVALRERSLANVLSPVAPREHSLAIAESFSSAPLLRIRT